jgi:hypothetical protein
MGRTEWTCRTCSFRNWWHHVSCYECGQPFVQGNGKAAHRGRSRSTSASAAASQYQASRLENSTTKTSYASSSKLPAVSGGESRQKDADLVDKQRVKKGALGMLMKVGGAGSPAVKALENELRQLDMDRLALRPNGDKEEWVEERLYDLQYRIDMKGEHIAKVQEEMEILESEKEELHLVLATLHSQRTKPNAPHEDIRPRNLAQTFVDMERISKEPDADPIIQGLVEALRQVIISKETVDLTGGFSSAQSQSASSHAGGIATPPAASQALSPTQYDMDVEPQERKERPGPYQMLFGHSPASAKPQ